MKRLLIASLSIIFGLSLLQSCVKDKFDIPNNDCLDQITEIQELEQQGLIAKVDISYLKNNIFGLIDTSVYIEGVVVADDKSGNYFKEIVLQDATGGISVLIDKNSFFVEYPVGRKIYIKLRGLFIDSNAGMVKLGVVAISGNQVSIPNALIKNYFFKGPCNQEIVPQVVSINGLNPSLQNMFVKIEGLEFVEGNGVIPFGNPPSTSTQNRIIKDCSNNEVVVRTSGFANFAKEPLPQGNGAIYGIYSVFNNTKQLYIRDLNDVSEMIDIRCNGNNPNDTLTGTTRFHLDDILVAEGATSILSQDFEGTSGSGSIAITGWTTFSQIGSVSWSLDNFSGNKYARISGFNSGDPDIITWLVSPAFDLSATSNEVFSCRVQSSYDDGARLQVLVSTDYSGSGSPASATWTNLNAVMPVGPTNAFGTFQNVGPINMPSINSSTVYLAFRYLGGV